MQRCSRCIGKSLAARAPIFHSTYSRPIHTSISLAMKWSVQIVNPNTHNSGSTSVLVRFNSGRYLFNCGEGIQRLSFENKLRLGKLSNIFLTRVHWETMGGLPGMLLTLSDGGTKNLTISGGHNLAHALASTRHFIFRSQMGVKANEMRDGDPAAVYKDENITVEPVHTYPDQYMVSAAEWGPDESEDAKIRSMFIAKALGVLKDPDVGAKKKRQPMQNAAKKGYYPAKCEGAGLEKQLQRIEEAGKKRARSPEHKARKSRSSDLLLPKAAPTPAALSYIITASEVPGKFNVEAAQALGLRPGPLYKKLHMGESVTLPDGRVVHSSQCVGEPRPGRVVIIVDCPSPKYIGSLISNPRFRPYIDVPDETSPASAAAGNDPKSLKSRLVLVIHSLGPGVAEDERYRAWAAQFPSHVSHMVSAPEYVPDANPFQRHLRIQASMAAIDPQTYVLPQGPSEPELPLSKFIDGKNLIIPRSMMTFEVEPKPKIDSGFVRELQSPENVMEKAKQGMLYSSASPGSSPPPSKNSPCADRNDDAINSAVSHSDSTCCEPTVAVEGGSLSSNSELVVCPIGTGSSVPGIYRNVSANIVQVKGYGGVVLDCGESTVSLLKRFLGYPARNVHNHRIDQSYTEFLMSLKLLYISHLHADHHLGAILLLHEWNRLTGALPNPPRLTVVAPARFWAWLVDISGAQDIGLKRVDFISCHDLRIGFDSPVHRSSFDDDEAVVRLRTDKLKQDLGLTQVLTCGVVHCPWAYGLSLTHSSGWRLVYSGDTRPCTNLITLGRTGDTRPTILLHEATHSDDLLEDAIAKRHTTVSEAVAMAVGMDAENLLMTHFSQRCLSLPKWNMANIQAVKLARYGQLVGDENDTSTHESGAEANGSRSAEMDIVEDEPLEMAVDEAIPAPDIRKANEELMRELSEDNEDGDGQSTPAANQNWGLLGSLNIASAFDMSAYGPSDILRYRQNVRNLRAAMRQELQLFIAEENESGGEESDQDSTKKANARPKNAAKQKAKGSGGKNGANVEKGAKPANAKTGAKAGAKTGVKAGAKAKAKGIDTTQS